MQITDAHSHIFPEKISLKASGAIGEFYEIKMRHNGLPEVLAEESRKAQISRNLVCSTATTPHQVRPINDFIYEKCLEYPQFIGLATLHQDMDDPEAEIERAQNMGLRGIKLHPDFQRLYIDDPKMFPTYKVLAERHLPILFHTGDKRYDYSSPARLINIMQKFPELICIGAHFGGYSEWERVRGYDRGGNLYFDTSSALGMISNEDALSLIDYFGTDRFMFGTDFPMWNPKEEIEKFLALGLSDEDNKKIFNDNFERLFGI